jgi:hypothetical protein
MNPNPRLASICVHLSCCLSMTMTDVPAVGPLARKGLAFPAASLIEDGGPTAPVGVSPALGEQLRDLVPTPVGFGPFQLAGLRDRLTGHGQRQGQAPP